MSALAVRTGIESILMSPLLLYPIKQLSKRNDTILTWMAEPAEYVLQCEAVGNKRHFLINISSLDAEADRRQRLTTGQRLERH